MDIMPAWMGGVLMGAGLALTLVFLHALDGERALFFFLVFLAGVGITYMADNEEWARATSRDRPQKEETASAAKQP